MAFLVGGLRTPHGRYGGSLRDVRVVDLGARVAREALTRAGVDPGAVDEVIVSNCRQAGNGPNPGRQIAVRAGVGLAVPAQTINMACASGLKAIQLAHRAVSAGDAEVVLVVAAESMSTMPYLAPYTLRWEGLKRGDVSLVDGWRDGGTDPLCGLNMGETAERIASAYSIEREAQDAWSARSHQRAERAWDTGLFADEVMPLDELSADETYRRDSTVAALERLKPSFVEGGTVTAGNSSQMVDGAAALVVASERAVRRFDLHPAARLLSFAAVGVDPAEMGIGPTQAIPLALSRAGRAQSDIDLFEINEAFAAQIVHNVRTLGLDEERVNVNGGGVALGHPTGQSGTRIVVSLLHELARRDAHHGVASLCVGGGQGVAAVLERV